MIDGLSIEYNKTEVLLGIKIDQELCVENKSDVQFNVLVGIAPFMDINKKRNIINAFVASQFDSSHLIWMFHSRGLNNKSYSWKKNTFTDKSPSFSELLNKNISETIHLKSKRELTI